MRFKHYHHTDTRKSKEKKIVTKFAMTVTGCHDLLGGLSHAAPSQIPRITNTNTTKIQNTTLRSTKVCCYCPALTSAYKYRTEKKTYCSIETNKIVNPITYSNTEIKTYVECEKLLHNFCYL